jgi:hypothetical protein
LLRQTPLLLALLIPSLIAVVRVLRERPSSTTVWEGSLPEALFFILAFLALLLSPSPQPHNLLEVVAFAFLLSYRYASAMIKDPKVFHLLRPLTIGLILFAHLIPFYASSRRHFAWPNHRQESLIRFAEQLTSRDGDRVYDGIGMLPTRRGIRSQWFLESLNLRASNRDLETLVHSPAAVVIYSYRAERLPAAESDFIRKHYVPLGDDFWVLGAILPQGGGEFEVVYPGRYRISARKQSNLLGTYPEGLADLIKAAATKEVEIPFTGTLDGVAISNRPLHLKVGAHRVESRADDEIAVVWVGPDLEKPPQVGRGDRRRLFVNGH